MDDLLRLKDDIEDREGVWGREVTKIAPGISTKIDLADL